MKTCAVISSKNTEDSKPYHERQSLRALKYGYLDITQIASGTKHSDFFSVRADSQGGCPFEEIKPPYKETTD